MCVSKQLVSLLSRVMVLAILPLFLAACMSSPMQTTAYQSQAVPGPDPFYRAMYGAQPNERFPLPATDIRNVDERFYRQQVDYHRSEPAGTIVVDDASGGAYRTTTGLANQVTQSAVPGYQVPTFGEGGERTHTDHCFINRLVVATNDGGLIADHLALFASFLKHGEPEVLKLFDGRK
jgi:hypothetical protein